MLITEKLAKAHLPRMVGHQTGAGLLCDVTDPHAVLHGLVY